MAKAKYKSGGVSDMNISASKRITLVYIGDALLPVPPEKITYKAKNQNKTFKLINGEEINQVLPPGLMEITMDKILLPNEEYSFCSKGADGKVLSAAFFMELFATLKREKRTFQLVINNSSDGLCNDGNAESGMYTLENYTVSRSIDMNNDFEASLTFKEYKDYGTQSITFPFTISKMIDNAMNKVGEYLQKTNKRKSTKNTTEEQTYTVKSGDTLWAISKKFYGDGSLYPYLVNLNNIKNANSLKVGQVLRIGPKEDAEAYCKNNKSKSRSSGSSSKSKSTGSSKLTASSKTAITNKTGKVVGSGQKGALNKFEQAIQQGIDSTNKSTLAYDEYTYIQDSDSLAKKTEQNMKIANKEDGYAILTKYTIDDEFNEAVGFEKLEEIRKITTNYLNMNDYMATHPKGEG